MTPTDWAALTGLLVLLPALCGVMSWLSMRYYNRHTRLAQEQWTEAVDAREKAMSQHADALAAHETVLQSWESGLMHRELEFEKRVHDREVELGRRAMIVHNLIDGTLDEITEINWSIPD